MLTAVQEVDPPSWAAPRAMSLESCQLAAALSLLGITQDGHNNPGTFINGVWHTDENMSAHKLLV